MQESYSEFPNLETLLDAVRQHGAERILYKRLGRNNNDKQQIYLATDVSKISILPIGKFEKSPSTSGRAKATSKVIFRFALPFEWVSGNGVCFSAPETKLIFYPQYPEVRLSGFMDGCKIAPSELMTESQRGKEDGRILLFAIRKNGAVIGHVVSSDSPVAREVLSRKPVATHGALKEISGGLSVDTKELLLSRLAEIHQEGWIESRKLTESGTIPYDKPNGVGYTLEAMLGVRPNGNAGPDFIDWEVKASTVKSFQRSLSVKVSILAGSPTGGLIKELSWRKFVLRYGYRNPSKPGGRIDFNGCHYFGRRHKKTGMTLGLEGYKSGAITQEDGGVVLLDDEGNVLLKWHFSKLMEHWKKKHDKVVFVPAMSREGPREYWYGRQVLLGIGTKFSRLMNAIENGHVVYDTGMWVNPQAESASKRGHQRHQIRLIPGKIDCLYERVKSVDVLMGV